MLSILMFTRMHCIQKLFRDGIIVVIYVATGVKDADILTKALGRVFLTTIMWKDLLTRPRICSEPEEEC